MADVTLINCFEVPVGREEEFLGLWKQVNAYMRTKPGYLGHKLYRAQSPNSPGRFVNVARWASAEHFQGAHDQGFRAMVGQPDWKAFPSSPGLYEVIHEGEAEASAAMAPQGTSV